MISAAWTQMDSLRDELKVHKDVEKELHEMNRLFQQEGKRQALQQNKQTLETELARLRVRVEAPSTSGTALRDAMSARDAVAREVDETSERFAVLRTDWVRDQQEALTRRDQLRAQYQEVKDQ